MIKPPVVPTRFLKEPFEFYRTDPTKNHAAMDPVDKLFHDAYSHYLENPAVKTVILLAGPPGSGKTTVRNNLGKLDPDVAREVESGAAVIVDRTMGTGEEAIEFIEKAIACQKKTFYIHALRNFHQAIPSILDRSIETGRCVQAKVFAQLALGSLANTTTVLKRFSSRVKVAIANNTGNIDEISFIRGNDEISRRLEEYTNEITGGANTADPHDAVANKVEDINQELYRQRAVRHAIIEATSGVDALHLFLARSTGLSATDLKPVTFTA